MQVYRFASAVLTVLIVCASPSIAVENAEPPCGDVVFRPAALPRTPSPNVYIERIAMTVSLADGRQQRILLPYPWVYANPEVNDPWSSTQIRLHLNDSIAMVLPPPGTDTRAYDPLLKFVLAHTTAAGLTTLSPCPHPMGTSPPSASPTP